MARQTIKQRAEAYLTGSCECIFCGSDNITGDQWDLNGDQVSQNIFCNDCEREWTDFYRLETVAYYSGRKYTEINREG